MFAHLMATARKEKNDIAAILITRQFGVEISTINMLSLKESTFFTWSSCNSASTTSASYTAHAISLLCSGIEKSLGPCIARYDWRGRARAREGGVGRGRPGHRRLHQPDRAA